MLLRNTKNITIVVVAIVVATAAADDLDPPNPTTPPGPSDAPMGVYSKAAVVANGYLCAPIGR